VADNEQHRAALQELNRNYIRSVDEADVAWFDANLAADFRDRHVLNGVASPAIANPFQRSREAFQ
jgi:hypothetical protein